MGDNLIKKNNIFVIIKIKNMMKINKILGSLLVLIIFFSTSCDPFNTLIEKDANTVTFYKADNIKIPAATDSLKIVSWNIKFGAGRIDFFFDCYGDRRVIMTEDEVNSNMNAIVEKIISFDPDVIFLQEADILSKRSAFVDQVKFILDNTDLNYGVYASQWKADYVPSDGVGKVNSGNAILSKYELSDAERIPLSLIGEDPAYIQYFYLRRNIVKATINAENNEIVLFNTHTSAYSNDDTKINQLKFIKEEIDKTNSAGKTFIIGGDFNILPPNSVDSMNFDDGPEAGGCDSINNPSYYEYGFEGQLDYMKMFYDDYKAAISPVRYGTTLATQKNFFSFTANKDGFWNRKLDFIFTNDKFMGNSGKVHQNGNDDGLPTMPLSDHAPLSVKYSLK